MTSSLRPGDFSRLADDYSAYRPGYCPSVLSALLGLYPSCAIDCADVGAGTGIWTRMVAAAGVRSVVAVEPDDSMRANGERDSAGTGIVWRKGTGDATGLGDASVDWLSMASSFHWVDTAVGLAEFARVLRPGGRFVALWNPRWIEANPLLVEIESTLTELCPDLKRVSSGRSGVTETLAATLRAHPLYEDVLYLEGEHVARQSPAQYLGAWRSVNDVQAQLGAERFATFLARTEARIKDMDFIETTYRTRAWTARRKG
ncbi:putative methyltransferase [Magnetospirillum sp. LM-5]|uniref:class I SAM-dependent methyltransferase n=1 Tax=Magnetospirillum sp. LM-5 TaxID=2681466 RepID=UPI00137EE2E8|nr:class I SAM-dependent methyltransferase [Magnetospirillum sp. LM-5]CAA7613729.1 putative methyltransferase [Magnetospirillum sp. LM-5]